MFKIYILGRKKAGMSDEEFRDAYERDHVIWGQKLKAQYNLPKSLKYHRNYVQHDDADNIGGPFDFDSITEVCFNSREDFLAGRKAMQIPEYAEEVRKNLGSFMEMDSLRYIIVSEYDGDGNKLS